MAGIASSLISAFLQHQFAKERQEQENKATTERQAEARQQQLQQALQLREMINDQQDRQQQQQIAERKAMQEDVRAFRAAEAAKYKLTTDMTLKLKQLEHDQGLADAKLKSDITLKRQQAMADYRLAQSSDPKNFTNRIKLLGLKLRVKPYEDEIQSLEGTGKTMLNNLREAYSFLQIKHPDLLPQSPAAIDEWSAKINTQLITFQDPKEKAKIVAAMGRIRQFWNPLTVGIIDRKLADEKGARALAIFEPQLIDGKNKLLLHPAASAQLYFNDVERLLDKQINHRRGQIADILEKVPELSSQSATTIEPEE